MKVKSVLSTLYYFLFIVIALWILYSTTGVKNFFVKKEKYEGYEEEDEEDEEEEVEKPKKKKKYQYRDLPNFNVTLSNDKPEETLNNMDFDTFKELATTDEFVSSFYLALKESYKLKGKFYAKLLKEEIDNMPNVENQNSHNTNRERAKEKIFILKNILKSIKESRESISEDTIKNNLKKVVHDENDGFASLVGRKDIKDFLAKKIYAFSRGPKAFFKNFQNIILRGNSGIGKTKIGNTIGFIYSEVGIFVRKKTRKVTGVDLTSQFVKESASLTRGVYYSCLEGVLEIDEISTLDPKRTLLSGGNNHAQEAIDELVNLTGEFGGYCVVVLMGYHKEMKSFIRSNQGIARRIKRTFKLKDYTPKQLTDIFIEFLHSLSDGLNLTEKDASIIYNIIDILNNRHVFDKQAGDMKKMAGDVLDIMNSTYTQWGENTENNYRILASGVNEFLNNKGAKFYIGKYE